MENKDIFAINEDRNFGFKVLENKIQFLIPKQLAPKHDNYLYYLMRYAAILNKYNKSIHIQNTNIKNTDINYNENMNLDILNSYLVLLDDYLKYNEFKLFEVFYKTHDKKINWNKTLKANDIIISKNNIIYNSFFSKDNNINSYNQYYLLYLEALRRVKLLFLGIYNQENDYPKNKNEQHYHIYKYIDEHYKDREILIAKNLINIFLNDSWFNSYEKNFEFKYFLKFEHIWQKMIENNLKNFKETIELPKGYYNVLMKEKDSLDGGLNLRPDHFIKIEEEYFLLDSKFYNSYEDYQFPDTTDISKQFIYKYLLEKKYLQKININNIFIFPKSSNNKKPELIAIHQVDGYEEFTIFCIAVDTEQIISNYLSDNLNEELVQFLKGIKKINTKEIKLATIPVRGTIEKHKKYKEEIRWMYEVDHQDNKYIILKDSEMFESGFQTIKKKQQELLNQGVIFRKNRRVFVFTHDYCFDLKKFRIEIITGENPRNNVNVTRKK